MLRSVLVGLDGSDNSWAALDLALAWAQGRDLLVAGLGIIDEPHIRAGEPTPLGMDFLKEKLEAEKLHQAERRIEQILEQFALRCAAARVACKELETVGEPIEQIVREAQRFDVIVLGQHTYFRADRPDAPDDTLERVLRQGSRPVISVPLGKHGGHGVLVAYDGSSQAAHSLQLFTLLGLAPDQLVHVVSVDPDHAVAVRCGDRAADFLSRHGRSPQVHALAAHDAADAILAKMDELKPGLAVMGCFGHSAVREFFFGSVTKTLLAKSAVPLLLCH